MGTTDVLTDVDRVLGAHTPHDIFGDLEGSIEEQLQAARVIYRALARATHPDATDDARAGEAFAKLTRLHELASGMIISGSYADPGFSGLLVRAKRRSYYVGERLAKGDIADVHLCDHGIIKISRSPRNNDLLRNEARSLKLLRRETPDYMHVYYPALLDAFGIRDSSHNERAANVFETLPGRGIWVTASRIIDAFPGGVDPRDVAWIWRRLLVAIGTTQDVGLVHHAVLPDHVLVLPEQHGIVLVDWCYAVELGAKPQAIVPRYRHWYPEEVGATRASNTGTDVFMAAKVAIAIMGGDPAAGTLPQNVPRPLRAYFRACTLRHVSRRPDDPRRLLESFDEIIERLWGPRRFREFRMP
jgi:hypothetical protein